MNCEKLRWKHQIDFLQFEVLKRRETIRASKTRRSQNTCPLKTIGKSCFWLKNKKCFLSDWPLTLPSTIVRSRSKALNPLYASCSQQGRALTNTNYSNESCKNGETPNSFAVIHWPRSQTKSTIPLVLCGCWQQPSRLCALCIQSNSNTLFTEVVKQVCCPHSNRVSQTTSKI